MKCRTVQNRLLIAEDPAHPAEEVQAHLQACAPCRHYQRRLLRLESHVPLLPIPPSQVRAEMVRQFLAGSAPAVSAVVNGTAADHPIPPPILALRNSPATGRRLIPRYRWYAAVGVAAAIFLLIFDGLVLWNPTPSGKGHKEQAIQDPLLASLLERDLRLAKAGNPRDRIEALADLADDLQEHTRKLSHRAEAEDLRRLAKLFERVVEEGIVRGAPAVPAAQRPRVLGSIADRLTRAGQDAGSLAAAVPESSAPALRLIALAARHGGDQLRALAREAIP